jgi:hypothetical protein
MLSMSGRGCILQGAVHNSSYLGLVLPFSLYNLLRFVFELFVSVICRDKGNFLFSRLVLVTIDVRVILRAVHDELKFSGVAHL